MQKEVQMNFRTYKSSSKHIRIKIVNAVYGHGQLQLNVRKSRQFQQHGKNAVYISSVVCFGVNMAEKIIVLFVFHCNTKLFYPHSDYYVLLFAGCLWLPFISYNRQWATIFTD